MLENVTATRTTLTPTTKKTTKSLKMSAYPVENVEIQTIPQRNVTMEPMQQTNHFPRSKTGNTERTSTTRRGDQYNQQCHGCSPCFQLNLPRLHSGTACEGPETIELITLPRTPEVVWQLNDSFKLFNTNTFPTTITTQTAHTTQPRH